MSVTSTGEPDTLTARVAEEVRAVMARRRISQAALARRLNVSQMWVSDRLRGVTPINLTDLDRIATILAVPVRDLIPPGGEASPRYAPWRQLFGLRPPDHPGAHRRPLGRARGIRMGALVAA